MSDAGRLYIWPSDIRKIRAFGPSRKGDKINADLGFDIQEFVVQKEIGTLQMCIHSKVHKTD